MRIPILWILLLASLPLEAQIMQTARFRAVKQQAHGRSLSGAD